MRRAVLVWAGSIALGAGCSLFTDLSGLGPLDAATDANPPGDGPSSDVQGTTDAQADATGNLLANPDFEQGVGACGPGWVTYNATLTRSSTAHSGQYSCLVCGSTAAAFSMFASPRPLGAVAPGQSYFAQAWFSTVADAALGSVALELYEYYDDAGGGTPLGYSSVSGSTQGWQAAQIPATVQEAGASVGFEVHAGMPDGSTTPGCFLIDDTELLKQ